MTPEEAKQKWCPFALPSFNRILVNEGGNETKCIASDCMAWRWYQKNAIGDDGPLPDAGYCGLAGKQ